MVVLWSGVGCCGSYSHAISSCIKFQSSSTRVWTYREMEIVEVVVALSHASVLE